MKPQEVHLPKGRDLVTGAIKGHYHVTGHVTDVINAIEIVNAAKENAKGNANVIVKDAKENVNARGSVNANVEIGNGVNKNDEIGNANVGKENDVIVKGKKKP